MAEWLLIFKYSETGYISELYKNIMLHKQLKLD